MQSLYNITVLNVYNTPDYKAMLLNSADQKKVSEDQRFLPGNMGCGEMVLEVRQDLLNVTDIHELSNEVVSSYHVKVTNVIDMPTYKAIVMLAEIDNPITKDPRFMNYNQDYAKGNGTSESQGAGELNQASGHIAAATLVLNKTSGKIILNQTVPEDI